MEIVVRQISGLGNQLFQYAAGRFYAKKYGASLRIATELAKRAESYGYPRPFLLTKFAIQAPTCELTTKERILLWERRALSPASSCARRALGVQVIREPFSERYTFQPELTIRKEARTVFLLGYWQVHSIADAISRELRAEFRLIEPPQGRNLEMLNKIQQAPIAVSLHIRRGDYTHPAEGNAVLPMGYYLRSIRATLEKFPGAVFFVFSDEIPFAKTNLPKNLNLVFVDHNDLLSPHEDLRLMSACRHHIIANSTLSWWGAWLNPAPNKIVFAPKHWRVGGCAESRDLLPPEWLLIDDLNDKIEAASMQEQSYDRC